MSTALTKSLGQNRAMVNSFQESAYRLKASGGLGSMISPSITGNSFFGGFRDQAKSRESYGSYRNWLYSAINALAMEAAGQPIVVAKVSGAKSNAEKKKPGGSKAFHEKKMARSIRNKAAAEEYEILVDHPIMDTMEHPNEMQHRWQFIYSFIANLNLTGWSYIIFDQDEDGRLKMYSLPTTWVRPDHTAGPFSKFYITNPNNPGAQPEPLTKEQVAFAYLPDPSNPLAALAPATSQMPAIRIDDYIQTSQQQYFQKGIFPSVVVTLGKNPHPDVPGGIRPCLSGAQRREIKLAIDKAMAGVANYGDPAIIDGMIESITKFSNTAPEMGWAQSEDKVRTRILSVFAVHPYILGEPVGVGGYAQVANIEKRFYKRVNSMTDMLSTILTQIVKTYSEDKLLVWVEECQVVDPSLRQAALQFSRTNGDISQNEWRAELGMPPDEDRNEALLSGPNATIVATLLPAVGQGAISRESMLATLIAMGLPEENATDIVGPEPPPKPEMPEVLPGQSLISAKPVKPQTEEEAVQQATEELKTAIGLLKAPPEVLVDLIMPSVLAGI
jgi:phage portal protein BeeE